ncbi:MAG TPA: ATP-binding protein, partial [Verrucomicrobiae bacterium]|nr:ATP-binding protein [Verrucomicrobiae bacterium]
PLRSSDKLLFPNSLAMPELAVTLATLLGVADSGARPVKPISQQQMTRCTMPTDVPVPKTEGPNDGLDFVSVLRDCLSCGVIVLDERQKVTGFNPRAEQLTGLKSATMAGHGSELLPAPLESLLKDAFSSSEPVSHRQVMLRNAKGADFAVLASANSVLTADGKVSGCVLVLNDVSAIRKWEGNMRRLDRLHSVGTLSASMAHEVKNAFVAVRTFVDLLLEKNKEMELASVVRQELNRIDSMVKQMLKFSGPPKPELTSVHVHLVLDKSLLLIRHLLEEKKIRLKRSFTAASDVMNGDQDQLEQAFLNLFFNALDAMDSNGNLEVSTTLLPPGAKIEGLPVAAGQRYLNVIIRDSGIGIPSENMGRLFEPFFTTKPEGTGLGLAITRRIIQEHQGIISVQSELNKGTAFSLVFPARV